MWMSDQLAALRLFVRVAHAGSFSRAAKEMKLSQPTASRLISVLEEQLGATLLVRTTRSVTLTDAGRDYLASVQTALDTLDQAEHDVRGNGELRGRIRVASSSIFASRVIVPSVAEFMALHPSLKVELIIEDQRQDLIAEGVDVAIRFGKLADSTAIARSLGRWRLILAAAPRYLEKHGAPNTPDEVANHRAILAGPAANSEWTFNRGDEQVTVRPAGDLSITGSEVGINASLVGLGMVVASYPSLRGYIGNGELVRLLPEWEMAEIESHALFASGQAAKPAARAFVDYLQQLLKNF
ncbi:MULTISPECIES: LysR family transcriptional regulator [Rhizobium]|uniref:HTH-type transcriptional regulator TtuA n=1 Tax=Rhizobium esperanzae TaxID=1967781 RepID=A0A7W6XT91_9HYPH|nr:MULTISPECIES: LysR family transcriptional regulator [Rhizobium]MBB4438173.1 DNA-binding transcriptional LysR family regulator [Rhizobium esperanzae]MDH6200993.1 DNA-binding transcriptional LysR family regulator [Rhizobium leguminosarum]